MPEQGQPVPVPAGGASGKAPGGASGSDGALQVLPFLLRGNAGATEGLPTPTSASALATTLTPARFVRPLRSAEDARAASVEAAAAAVMRAAAAVEAAASTVHSAAAAVDMAAAAIGLASKVDHPAPIEHASLEPAPIALAPLAPALIAPRLFAPHLLAPAFFTPAFLEQPLFEQRQHKAGALNAHRLAGLASASDPRARFRRVAIIHYWLVTMRGGERVLERLLQLFPEADIFTHVYDPAAMSDAIRARTVRTSFIQKLPGARRHYQAYLPLMPMALEQLDLRGYDLVISSESGPAKGVITAPDALHICYVHSPMRYLWDHYHDYRADAGWLKRAVMPLLCHGLRQWDTASAARVDRVLANSNFIRERIAKAWRREADVVHPPVDPALFAPSSEVEPGYLWVGQLVPYKRADLAIDAFNALGLPLTVVGDGPQAAALKKRAGPTIRMIPRLSFDELRRAYARCRALVFTAEEDFGIVPVEVMASGRPVIAYGRGGALDSVVAERTGLFFAEQSTDALVEAVRRMEAWLPHFDPAAALARARDFAPEHFDRGVLEALA